jgi:hypothetical protein
VFLNCRNKSAYDRADMPAKSLRKKWERNSRSLQYATPGFLSRLVALASSMRLALLKVAHVAADKCRVTANPGALRSGSQFSLGINVLAFKQNCHPDRSAA